MGGEERSFLSPGRKQLPVLCSDGGVGRKLREDLQKRTSLNYLSVHPGIYLNPISLHGVAWASGNREVSRP